MELEIKVDLSGPISRHMAHIEAERYAAHVEQVLGDTGVTMIKAYLPTQYMYLGHHGGTPRFNPVPPNAGYLASRVHTERQVGDALHIVDDPVIYGPWIEGIAPGNLIIWPHKRNPPPRRFPGYHTFRKISESLNAMAVPIAYRELPVFVQMMNGL